MTGEELSLPPQCLRPAVDSVFTIDDASNKMIVNVRNDMKS